ncbi:MAG TPA: class III signal peptide-containing protein [Methanothermobacter sp.]|uniref:Class III signal peptide n=1 Tax=Methanothermobacter tenebrarum TaxID=680118 RepID=A0ABM7YCK3_9EURY|nr:class III signal peptide-containing protein [Methanothermobacter tenebrarum]MDD3455036.1 class III signal peptide-containing protein [Methanobacteriales archaeon]MDI6881937.1 class III signal peptide-containing protein [Methanothermobacter sp.]MDX9693406.1 class III signal peptide-containing protein [Methanothermobacter sp.]BDH79061.1 class III signal peptide [Methanothermobacter tenebrarum]HHW16958.1 class III signal peptide-containing protein [Methanothermobacter sp.]
MDIRYDEIAQGSAELILLFGGVIIIVIFAALWYKNYLISAGNEINKTDVQTVTNSIQNLKNKF